MKRTTLPLFLLLCAVMLLVVAPAALAKAPPPGSTAAFDAAMAKLAKQHYSQQVESYLDSLGSTTLGFRLAGTPADNAAADYIEAKFTAMGLANVRQEGVPVDAFDMRDAWVRVGGRTMAASTFDGIPGTNGNLDGEIVYVGQGTAADYDKLGSDVTGKIVLIDIELDDWWLNFPAALAGLEGAKGVIATYGKETYPWYVPWDSLGANDAEYDMSYPPMVYVSRRNGAWLKSQLAAGPVTGTMRSDVDVTMHDFATPANGGLGHNVVGEIAGTNTNAKAVLVASHHDAHFRAGMDDTGAVANMLTIAKAMKMSGYKPHRTIIFLATTGEEFGYTNAWFDWCIGAWWAATHEHSDAATDPAQKWTGPNGRLALFINMELMARKGGRLNSSSSTALAGWARTVAKANKALLPWGCKVTTPISTWEDGWTFTAAGVPSLVFEAGGADYDTIYHTTSENMAKVDFGYLNKIGRFVYRLERKADTGLLPYRLYDQANNLAAAVHGAELKAAGADAATVDAAVTAVKAYKAATAAYEARKAKIPAAHRAAVNDGLFQVEEQWNTHLTGLDIWDYQAYPFQQTMWDAETLQAAIGYLQAVPADGDNAATVLSDVGMTWYGDVFGPEVYAKELVRHQPDYELVTWAGQVDRPWAMNLQHELDEIDASQYSAALADLQAILATEIDGGHVTGATPAGFEFDGLNARLVDMTTTLNALTLSVKSLK
ncbi:MAG TPA: M28 family peptidase [Thermoleophilia bacterium]|nr:M28 family peptidase [Thermoleophilia bacterium]